MQKRILIHGSGHKAASWKETISYLNHREDILCPELANLLNRREASYPDLRTAFVEYCAHAGEPFHLCGLSLGEFWPWTMHWNTRNRLRHWC